MALRLYLLAPPCWPCLELSTAQPAAELDSGRREPWKEANTTKQPLRPLEG